MTEEEIANE